MKKQKLTLVRGVPGSGKTTLAKKIDAHLMEADLFFINQKGEYNFSSKLIKEAHAWCQLETKRMLRSGHSVVVANTFVRHWEMDFYLKLASKEGVEVEIIEAQGNYKNVHGVSDEVVERMRNQYEPFVLKPIQGSESSQLSMG